jgi:Uma2 family endonuclease
MVATRLVTIEEFAAMPLEGSWELVDGVPSKMTPSSANSGWIAGELFGRLRDHVRSSQLGWAFPPETGFILFGDRATVRSPDGAFVRKDRLPNLGAGFVPVAPDLAIEVLSPTDRMADALSKVAMYIDAGVSLVWLVDPASLTVIVFRSDTAPKSLAAEDILDGGDVLPGFSVPVAEIFS